ncbi:hypothetical protein [Cytobacillus sp. IB215665]|nr:hypothetical protein [Cytobacillus sp. IB215665]MDX8366524.1 hypothetical protein [Cytobacillus sp. IB215665]
MSILKLFTLFKMTPEERVKHEAIKKKIEEMKQKQLTYWRWHI